MCGIAGIINLQGADVSVSELTAMNQVLVHRGPDGEGYFCRGPVGFSHRRLAIIDPMAGFQPFYNDDRSVVVSYNGEIYNYLELRDQLKSEYTFRTDSDTEVLVRAYEKWGIGCLEKFRGMFAFALYDSRNETVYIVRDRVGIKPLYYCQHHESVRFASELTSLVKTGASTAVDSQALCAYFYYQYVPAPLTIYTGINKLEPGHYLQINLRDGTIAKIRYWTLTIAITQQEESACLREFNSLLDETMKLYCRSDVPFGAFLSGGTDSSLISALMAGQLHEPVKTTSIGFNEEKYSELPYARQVSSRIGSHHSEKVIAAGEAVAITGLIVEHFGEPFADSSAIPMFFVSREAARNVKMVLSGDGGDELFGGYLSYLETYRDLPEKNHLLAGLIRCMLPVIPSGRLRRRLLQIAADPQQKHENNRSIFRDEEIRELIRSVPSGDYHFRGSAEISGEKPDPVTLFQAQDFTTYLVDDVLTKVDRMSMANSLEVRVPFLDHKLVEFAFTLPLEYKLRRNKTDGTIQGKYLLKESAKRFFPESWLNRPKMGFGIPVSEWCLGSLRSLIEPSLRNEQNPIYQLLNFTYVNHLVDDFYGGNQDLAAKVWAVFIFDQWMKMVHSQNQEMNRNAVQ